MKKSLLYLATLATLAACKKDNEPVTYTGKVQMLDTNNQQPADQSGVSVTITDTSPQLTTETAADGTYSLQAPEGTHSFEFSRESYGTYKLFNVAGGAGQQVQLAPFVLGERAVGDVIFRGVRQEGSLYLVEGKVDPLLRVGGPHRLFLKEFTTPITSTQMADSYELSLPGHTQANGEFTDTITTAQLAAAHLIKPTGLTVVQVFGACDNVKASTYRDEPSGRTIYPAANLQYNPRPTSFYSEY